MRIGKYVDVKTTKDGQMIKLRSQRDEEGKAYTVCFNDKDEVSGIELRLSKETARKLAFELLARSER